MLIYWNLTNHQCDGYPIKTEQPVLKENETLGEFCQHIQMRAAQWEGEPLWWFYDIFHRALVLKDSHGNVRNYRMKCSFKEARHILRHQA